MFAGFESILEGICGPMLLGDLKLHDGGFYAHSAIYASISLTHKYLLTYIYSQITCLLYEKVSYGKWVVRKARILCVGVGVLVIVHDTVCKMWFVGRIFHAVLPLGFRKAGLIVHFMSVVGGKVSDWLFAEDIHRGMQQCSAVILSQRWNSFIPFFTSF